MQSTDFPVDTVAHVESSILKFEQLLRDGQLTEQQTSQVLGFLAAYLDPNFDTSAMAAPASAVYSGTAGSTTYTYVAIPNYPLNTDATQGAIKFMASPPPYGRPNSEQFLGVAAATTGETPERVRRYPGGSAFASAQASLTTAAASAKATLDATDFVTITAPTPGSPHIAGCTYDICRVVSGNYFLVAANVAPGGTAVDNGQLLPEYNVYTHNEVAWDTGSSVAVYGPNTTLGD